LRAVVGALTVSQVPPHQRERTWVQRTQDTSMIGEVSPSQTTKLHTFALGGHPLSLGEWESVWEPLRTNVCSRIKPLLSSLAHRLERRTGAKAKLCGPQGGQGPQSLLLNLGGLASFSLLICLQCLTVPESQGTVPNFSLLETSQHFLGSGLLLRGSMLIRKRPSPVWLSETLL
jgi:hypothetical protein